METAASFVGRLFSFLIFPLDRLYNIYIIISMSVVKIRTEVSAVKLSESPRSIQILRKAYSNGDGRKRISRNFWLRQEQDKMLAKLAAEVSETKVTVLRAIIDEWRDMKLMEGGK